MLPQISKFFDSFSILELAFSEKFLINHSSKINPLYFVISFFDIMNQDHFTWEGWSKRFYLISKTSCTPNGLIAKFGFRYIPFFKALLKKALGFSSIGSSVPPPIAQCFKRIWITDSTCISMPDSLHKIFPGASNQSGCYATAKLQLTMDLITDEIHGLDICSFRNNDQSYSKNILNYVNEGDLVIRDLGYFVTDIFKQLDQNKVKFISKIRYDLNIYNLQNEPFDLLKKLRDAFSSGASYVDWSIRISKKKIPVRLLAVRCNQQNAFKKNKRAVNDRQPRVNHNEEYMELLGYHILITNIEKDKLTVNDIWSLYKLRWRIEVIFKCWKGRLNLEKLFRNITIKNYSIIYCMLLLALTKIVICHNRIYIKIRNEVLNDQGIPNISILKFYDIVTKEIHLINGKSKKFLIQYFSRFSTYQNTKTRKTHFEMLYMLNSS